MNKKFLPAALKQDLLSRQPDQKRFFCQSYFFNFSASSGHAFIGFSPADLFIRRFIQSLKIGVWFNWSFKCGYLLAGLPGRQN